MVTVQNPNPKEHTRTNGEVTLFTTIKWRTAIGCGTALCSFVLRAIPTFQRTLYIDRVSDPNRLLRHRRPASCSLNTTRSCIRPWPRNEYYFIDAYRVAQQELYYLLVINT